MGCAGVAPEGPASPFFAEKDSKVLMPNNNLVSIGVPIYNESLYLRKALDSLLAQSYENFELLISDNGSTDGTPDICCDYLKNDKRVRVFWNDKNSGAIKNFNRVFEAASGKYFMWASGHDLWHPDFVLKCKAILDEDDDVVISYPTTLLIDLEDQPLPTVPTYIDTRGLDRLTRFSHTVWAMTTMHIYGLIRTDALKKTRLAVETLSPDHVLLAELSLLGTFAHVNEILFRFRVTSHTPDWESFVRRQVVNLVGANGTPFRFPAWRYLREMLSASRIVPMRFKERLDYWSSAFVGVLVRNKGNLLRDVAWALKKPAK